MKNNFTPRSKFEKWVREFGGTKKLADTLGLDQSAVQHWCARRATPTLRNVEKIIQLAKGSLTLSDLVKGTSLADKKN